MPKTCPYCQTEFLPRKFAQVCCNDYRCALKHVRKLRERKVEAAKRKSNRVARNKAKKPSDWLAEAQTACNAYIRERDKYLPCVSCGNTNPSIQYCAGHYRSRGAAPELRFHPFNIAKQCNKNCNLEKSGNIVEYRIRLKERIGEKNLEWLEGPHQPQKYTIQDAKDIKQYYKEQLKILKESHE